MKIFTLWFALLGLVAVVSLGLAVEPAETTLRFEVTVARGLLDEPREGRLLVVLARHDDPEPRKAIRTGMDSPIALGRDARLGRGDSVVLDAKSAIFPLESLSKLPARDYHVQAAFLTNPDLNLVGASGNLYGQPVKVSLDPARGGTVKLELTRAEPEEKSPPDTDAIKYLKLRSELLTKFHGRPMYLRAAVILPRDFDREADRKYPLRVHIGGYGTRFTEAAALMRRTSSFRRAWLADNAARMVLLHLDGAGPLGDPYHVNSANNGPCGDALTQELIPHVEKTFRCVGKPRARVLDGASTGGWVSLALQVFYPDFFNGAWAHCPDPVDFRAYETIDVYADENAYVNRRGFERPGAREIDGDTRYTVRHECRMENVLGRGDSYTLSGRDWGAWNAVFGPRGKDGFPVPLWDPKTGKIDPAVAEHYRKYDLRQIMEKDWKNLGPKLQGKLRIWVGEADDYFLNNAVHLLDRFVQKADPAWGGKITYGMRKDHNWRGLTEREMLAEMAKAVEAAGR